MNWRKTFFILPNLFTLASVFCGLFAITLASDTHDINQLYQAALAICAGFFFDTFDGRVARMTKTQSQLGLQLDSLSDVITFGAAPSVLVYKWGLSSFGVWGVFIAYTFCAAGALRLARFNVLSEREVEHHSKPGKFIVGLPIPAAAAVLVSLVVVNYKTGMRYPITQTGVAAMVLCLAYLMVSRVRFRSFKDLTINRKSVAVTFLLVVASITIYLNLRGSFIFVFLMASYIVLGLSEEIIFFRRRRRDDKAERERRRLDGQAVDGDSAMAEGPDDNEEDVLRELGAFDNREDNPA